MSKDTEKRFLEAYELYAEAIYRHCFFRIFSKEKAEELAQEAFLKTWEYVAQGKEVDNLRAFLYRVANNLVIDYVRKKKEESIETLQAQERFHEPSVSGEKEVQKKVLLHQAVEVMNELPDDYREVLTMRYIDDMDPKEIADVLGITANNVSVRLNRAVKALQEHFI